MLGGFFPGYLPVDSLGIMRRGRGPAMLSKINIGFIFISLLLLNSCGQSASEEIDGTILSTNIWLSKGNCQKAIDTINSISYQSRNASFLKTYASAYACRAGFSIVTFFADDIALTATPSPLGGMSIYSTSQTTVTGALESDGSFLDLQTAVNTLLYAGGISSTAEPTTTARANYFDTKDASEINSQLAFMLLAQLGKYMHFYADAGITGVKGSGLGSNNCFTSYGNTSGPVQLLIAALPGACRSTNSSHPFLDSSVSAATRKTRLCQGVVLLNSVFEVLPTVLASASGTSLSAIAGVTTAISAAKAVATPYIGTVGSVMSQANCESTATVVELESYFSLLFEGIIQ